MAKPFISDRPDILRLSLENNVYVNFTIKGLCFPLIFLSCSFYNFYNSSTDSSFIWYPTLHTCIVCNAYAYRVKIGWRELCRSLLYYNDIIFLEKPLSNRWLAKTRCHHLYVRVRKSTSRCL